MSVTERTTKARASAMFGKVTERDAQGRVKVVLVPGSEAKLYQVIIRRGEIITTECNCQTSIGNVPCKGNGKTVCYHSMAALIIASEEMGVEVSFCDTKADAIRLSNLGRKLTPVYAHGPHYEGIWLSTRKPKTCPEHKIQHFDNVCPECADEATRASAAAYAEVEYERLTASEEHRLAIRNAMYGEA